MKIGCGSFFIPTSHTMIATILTLIVALEHLYIMYMEMFAWETRGKRFFRSLPEDLFAPTRSMAANQGLYNGFLAAGLAWSFFIGDPTWSANVRLFFLGCVAVAGTYGALTASKKIFFAQALPAIVAMVCVLAKV